MREIVLIATVASLCFGGIVSPLIGLYGYVWFALMRPDVLAYSYGRYPYSLLLAIATAIGTVRYFGRLPRLFTNPISLLLLAYQAPLLLSVIAAQIPAYSWPAYDQFVRGLAIALLIPVLVVTESQLKILLLVMGASLGLLGTKFGLFGLLNNGVRFAEGYGGMISDNNDLALALTMSIPPMWYLRQVVSSHWMRTGLLGMTFCTTAAVVMTYSRGGALSLMAVLLLVVMRSQRKVGALVLVLVLVAPAIYLVGDSYKDRMSTIMDPTKEASANSRFELGKAAYHMWLDYPIFGVGFGGRNFTQLVDRYTTVQVGSVAHNTYLQVLADSGIFAFLMYVLLLFGTIGWLGFSIRRTRREAPDLVAYPVAIQASLVAFAVGSTFISRSAFDITFLYLMAAASWWSIARMEREYREAEAEALAAAEPPELTESALAD